MKPLPWEPETFYIAVDPASIKSGFAYQGFTEDGRRVRGAFHIDDIRFAWMVETRLKAVAEVISFKRVVLVVEYPTWNAGASQVVRGAANVFIRLFKAAFPRKTTVIKVDPNQWQGTFGYRQRKAHLTTKEHSLWLARSAYGWTVDTDDEADAVMILEHARVLPPSMPKKRTPKKRTPKKI